jgi:hypothetical protein
MGSRWIELVVCGFENGGRRDEEGVMIPIMN